MRITMKAAIQFAAVVPDLAPMAVTVFARASGSGISKERGHARLFVKPSLMSTGLS